MAQDALDRDFAQLMLELRDAERNPSVAGVLLVAFAALTIARGFGVPVMRYLHMGPAMPAAQDAPCH